MDIERVDLSDGAVADAWYEVYARADRFERPYAVPWLRGEIAEEFTPSLRADTGAYAGRVEGRIVCVGTVHLPLLDNTHSGTLDVYTDPDHRRLGYGAQMLAHLEGLARERERGRRAVYVEASYPYASDQQGIGSAAPDFLRAQGYHFGLGDIMRSLSLPLSADLLRSLGEGVAGHHEGYRLETFSGRVPDAWAADYVRLDASIATDAPSGTLEVEAGTTDLASFREHEERLARQGRTTYSAVALFGEEVVGYTVASVPRPDPSRGFQWGTLVAKEHRGHRLGLALKVVNLQQIQAQEPGMRSIVTWNAEENEQMIGVNDQIGFLPVERLAEFEKRW